MVEVASKYFNTEIMGLYVVCIFKTYSSVKKEAF